MRQRYENISIIKGLFGMDQDLLNETIGFKGFDYDNYTDEELETYANLCINIDDICVGE